MARTRVEKWWAKSQRHISDTHKVGQKTVWRFFEKTKKQNAVQVGSEKIAVPGIPNDDVFMTLGMVFEVDGCE